MLKKGFLNTEGLLTIERGGTMRKQYCPYDEQGRECGDWCPLFDEPREVSGSQTNITICNNATLSFHSFVDNRDGAASDEDLIPFTEGATYGE